MARGNISIVRPGGLYFPPSMQFRTEAGSTAIVAGEPVKLGGTGSNFAILMIDGDPELAGGVSADTVIGVASTDGTHTAAANGVVDVLLPLGGVVFSARALTVGSVDTDAELLGVLNDRVVFDLTAGVFTVDAAAGDSATNGIRIVGGDINTSQVHFVFLQRGNLFN